MNLLETTAHKWHLRSDHARDGAKFGSPICNCMNIAERMCGLLAEAWDDGWHAYDDAIELSNPDEYPNPGDHPNPYLEALDGA